MENMQKLRDSINIVLEEFEKGTDATYRTDLLKKVVQNFRKSFEIPLVETRLAHYKAAIESIAFHQKERKLLFIKYIYDDSFRSNFNATVRYIPGNDIVKKYHSGKEYRYKTGGYFIFVNDSLDSMQKRILVGHELGHILISLLNDEIYRPNEEFPPSRETLANILCLVMLIEQSDFYSEQSKKYIYSDDKLRDLVSEVINLTQNSGVK